MPRGAGAREVALTFRCHGQELVGVLHSPARPRARGVVVVVGAPQYRVGSHRQFVLLARELAAAGFPVLRFDYRGMGDSDGDFVGFEGVNEDVKAAVDCLFARVEGLSDVVLWGLCDGASAAAFYAPLDPRVGGLVVVNPWVRTGFGLARTRVSHYYLERVTSGAFWRRLLRADVDLAGSVRELLATLGATVRRARPAPEPAAQARAGRGPNESLPERVGAALRRFQGPSLLILSGADLTAQEFDDVVLKNARMRPWLRRPDIAVRRLEGATHTYATPDGRKQVHGWTIELLAAGRRGRRWFA